jgi:hypothetical protein
MEYIYNININIMEYKSNCQGTLGVMLMLVKSVYAP